MAKTRRNRGNKSVRSRGDLDTVHAWWLRQWKICLQCRRPWFDPWVRKMPWRRERPLTPVLLPGEFRGERSLVGHTVHGVAKNRTRLGDSHSLPCSPSYPTVSNLGVQHLLVSDFSCLCFSLFRLFLNFSLLHRLASTLALVLSPPGHGRLPLNNIALQ